MRSGPGELYPVVGMLSFGDRLHVLNRSDDGRWFRVSSPQGEGWVAGWLLVPEAYNAGQPLLLASTPTRVAMAATIAPPQPVAPSLPPTVALPPTVEKIPTPVQTPTAVPTLAPAPTATPVTPTPAAPTPVPATPVVSEALNPCAVPGQLWLIHPVDMTIGDETSFRWGFSTELPASCGFEVSLWRSGDPQSGVHNAVADNRNGAIRRIGANEYVMDVPFMTNLPSVRGTGDYYWTVAIVQIEPNYRAFGRQAQPAYVYMQLR